MDNLTDTGDRESLFTDDQSGSPVFGNTRQRSESPLSGNTHPREWAKRAFGAYASDSSNKSTPQKKVPLLTLSSGSEREPDAAEKEDARFTTPMRRIQLPNAITATSKATKVSAPDSDPESMEEIFDDNHIVRKKIGFKHQYYANTVCCSRGYKKDLLTTKEAVRLLSGVNDTDPVATVVPFTVQYLFDNEPHEITRPPHGNRRHGDQQYSRTFQSVKFKDTIKTGGRKEGMDNYNKQRHVLEDFEHPDEMIRGPQQVRNLTSKDQPKDDLWELICSSKLEKEHPEQHFIRDIVAAPEMVVFLSSERQLDDMVKFCTDAQNFSVLGVDTLFNVGEFLVTAVTYRHLMLKSTRSYSGTHPVMIGAIMIHTGRSEQTLSYLPYFLKKYRPQLRNLRAFGTDEERAIYNVLKDAFPSAVHFLCDLHLKDTVKRKMRELNVDERAAGTIIADIFGLQNEDTVTGGLVNCDSSEYDMQVEVALDKWGYMSDAADNFAGYFRKNKVQQIKDCMLLEKRIASGLGLNVYTQNANESSNNVLKQAAKREKVSLNEFVEVSREVNVKQEKEVELAGMARSERYFLLGEYRHLRVQDYDLYNKAVNPTSSHRAKAIAAIHRAQLVPKPYAPPPGDSTKNTPAQYRLTTPSPSRDDDEEEVVSDALEGFNGLSDIFKAAAKQKALHLLRCRVDLMSKVPGKTLASAAMVASESNGLQPNVLEMDRASGKVTCTCRGFQLQNICAHALAIAVDRNMVTVYCKWFNENNRKQIDKAVKHGVSKNVASKLSSTSRRKAPSKEFNPTKTIVTNKAVYRTGPSATVNVERTSATRDEPATALFTKDNALHSSSQFSNAAPSIIVMDRPKPVLVRPEAYTYELHFLNDCHPATRTCAGCHKSVHVGGKIGPAPEDIVVVSRIPRTYPKNGEPVMGQIGNAYFHVSEDCIKKELEDFDAKKLIILPPVRSRLLSVHRQHIKKVLRLQLDVQV